MEERLNEIENKVNNQEKQIELLIKELGMVWCGKPEFLEDMFATLTGYAGGKINNEDHLKNKKWNF